MKTMRTTKTMDSSKEKSKQEKDTNKINKNVKLLGITSLINDMSSEIIFPLLPFFLISLSASPIIIGFAGGIIEGISGIIKVISGYISDLRGRRKPLVIIGYSISQLSKLGIALSTNAYSAITLILFERSGKGVRTAPRDALIAESSKKTGKAFGFHRAMDSLGAVLGSTIALLLLYFHLKIRNILLIASIIGLFSLIPLILLKEINLKIKKPELGMKMHKFIIYSAIFGFANLSYMFFLIRSSKEIYISIAAYIIYNLIYATFSYPVGLLSDKIGKKFVASIGYSIMALSCISALYIPLIALIFLGLFMAFTDATQRGIAADLSKTQGFGLGAFQVVFGMSALVANVIYGILWGLNPVYVFITVFSVSIISSILYIIL